MYQKNNPTSVYSKKILKLKTINQNISNKQKK